MSLSKRISFLKEDAQRALRVCRDAAVRIAYDGAPAPWDKQVHDQGFLYLNGGLLAETRGFSLTIQDGRCRIHGTLFCDRQSGEAEHILGLAKRGESAALEVLMCWSQKRLRSVGKITAATMVTHYQRETEVHFAFDGSADVFE